MAKITVNDTFNPTELILDRVRYVNAFDLKDNRLLYRLTSVEDPQLTTTAEGEDVTDALGSVITTIYRSKAATFSGTNSLVHLDLMAAQYGTEKKFASSSDVISVPSFDTFKVTSSTETGSTATNQWQIKRAFNAIPKYIYKLKDNAISEQYTLGTGSNATDKTFTAIVNGGTSTITLPTSAAVDDEFYVEYEYNANGSIVTKDAGDPDARAVYIDNIASQFPTQCKLVIYVYFRDKCNDDIIYSGRIISERAKLNPESTELDLTSTGKHPFEYTIQKPYCEDSDDAKLFRVIVTP